MRIPFVHYVPFYIHVPVLKLLQMCHSQKREPDVFIGGRENTYMRRWYVIPHNKWFNIYLHQFLRSDDDRALHDHPWWNLSWVLSGGYYEVTAQMPGLHEVMDAVHYRGEKEHALKPGGKRKYRWRNPGALAWRQAKAAHRLQLARDLSGELSAWSLFITGPKVRVWGFWCREGWVAFDSAARKERRMNPGGPDGPCPD